jgi:hypothetical protein
MGRLRLCAAGRRDQPSHGNLIALALNAFTPGVGYAFWESIPMPAVFMLIREADHWTISPEGQSTK